MSKLEKAEFMGRLKEVQPGYRLGEEAAERINPLHVVTISGPSGAGKDTVRRPLADLGYEGVVSDTTRSKEVRNGALERNGVDYHFVGNKLGKVWSEIEARRYVQLALGPGNKDMYGTHMLSYPKTGTIVLDVVADSVAGMQALPFGEVTPVYLVPDGFDRWDDRFLARGDLPPEKIADRRLEAAASIRLGLNNPDFIIVVNDEVPNAVADIQRIIHGEDLAPDRAEIGREYAHEILERLEVVLA